MLNAVNRRAVNSSPHLIAEIQCVLTSRVVSAVVNVDYSGVGSGSKSLAGVAVSVAVVAAIVVSASDAGLLDSTCAAFRTVGGVLGSPKLTYLHVNLRSYDLN